MFWLNISVLTFSFGLAIIIDRFINVPCHPLPSPANTSVCNFLFWIIWCIFYSELWKVSDDLILAPWSVSMHSQIVSGSYALRFFWSAYHFRFHLTSDINIIIINIIQYALLRSHNFPNDKHYFHFYSNRLYKITFENINFDWLKAVFL